MRFQGVINSLSLFLSGQLPVCDLVAQMARGLQPSQPRRLPQADTDAAVEVF